MQTRMVVTMVFDSKLRNAKLGTPLNIDGLTEDLMRTFTIVIVLGRRGGLLVNELHSGSSGPGSSIDRGHCVALTIAVPLSTQIPRI